MFKIGKPFCLRLYYFIKELHEKIRLIRLLLVKLKIMLC